MAAIVLGWAASLAGMTAAPRAGAGAELQQLTSGPGNDTEAAWSPDGRRIAFQSDRQGTLGLYVLDLASKAVTPLVEGPGHAQFPAWSPDGKWIAYSYAHFTSTALQGQKDGHNIFLAPVDGGPPRRLTDGRCHDYAPVFRGDGKTIWFSSDRGGKDVDNAVSLYAVPAAGGEPEVVLLREGKDRAAVQASLSPDGRSFAYAAISSFRDNWRIRIAHVDRPDDGYSLTDARECFYAPRWSPVGTLLACTGFQVGDAGWGLWLLDARSGQRMRVDAGAGQCRSPAWSPDGRRLVVENNRSGAYKLYSLDAPALPAAPAKPTPVADAKQVLHYSFAERLGATVTDRSPLGNAGQIHGTPAWREGAVSFSAPGAWIAVDQAKGFDFGNGPFAVRAVVHVPDGCKFAMIAMGQYPNNRLGWQLFVSDDRRAQFNSRTTDLVYRGARSDDPLPINRPVTLVGVRDATGGVRLYVDGALQQAIGADAFYAYGPPVQVRIGTQYDGKTSFPGGIYDIAVYARELSLEELRGDSLKWFWAGRPDKP
jgi:Tol biopolymer transport system component